MNSTKYILLYGIWSKIKKKIRIGTDIKDVLPLSSESLAALFLVRFSKI